jgi:hypothetical protein
MPRWQYPSLVEPLPEILGTDKWSPVYPSQLLPKVGVPASIASGSFLTSPFPLVTIDEWLPSYPSRLDPCKRPFWSGEYVINPFYIVSEGPVTIDKWYMPPPGYRFETRRWQYLYPSFFSDSDLSHVPIPPVVQAGDYGISVGGMNRMGQQGPTIGGVM